MTDYEPGTVAVATVRGVGGVRVWKMASGTSWAVDRVMDGPPGSWRDIVGDEVVTDIRPLVVLDLHDGEAKELADYLSGVDMHLSIGDRLNISRQIRASTRPPRIPEPRGVGAVVTGAGYKDRGGPLTLTLVRVETAYGGGAKWVDQNGKFSYWDAIVDPVLIREGVDA